MCNAKSGVMSGVALQCPAKFHAKHAAKSEARRSCKRRRGVSLTKPTAKTGFSLIELVVALAAFMVLCVGGISLFEGVQQIATRAELALLALTLQSEQQKALVTATELVTTIDVDGSGYHTATKHHRFQRGVTLAFPPGAYGPPAYPAKPIAKAVTFAHNNVICYPKGTMSAGTIYFGNRYFNRYYALTNSIAHNSFLRLYQYRLNWIPL